MIKKVILPNWYLPNLLATITSRNKRLIKTQVKPSKILDRKKLRIALRKQAKAPETLIEFNILNRLVSFSFISGYRPRFTISWMKDFMSD